MHRWRLVSKEQNMLTTKGFSAKVRMSLSTKACWIWFLKIRFCLLIFFIAKRSRVDLWRTRNTALRGYKKITLHYKCHNIRSAEPVTSLPELSPLQWVHKMTTTKRKMQRKWFFIPFLFLLSSFADGKGLLWNWHSSQLRLNTSKFTPKSSNGKRFLSNRWTSPSIQNLSFFYN